MAIAANGITSPAARQSCILTGTSTDTGTLTICITTELQAKLFWPEICGHVHNTLTAAGAMSQVLFESQGRSPQDKKKAVDLEDMKFHQCVRLTRFESDRTISFIPPDGAFDLMSVARPAPAHLCAEGLRYWGGKHRNPF